MRAHLICGALLLAPLGAHGAGDAARGARLFHPCAHCHSTSPGAHLLGPSLASVFNGKAGSVEGFDRYSGALRNSGKTWDAETLDQWLADPAQFIPGNTMAFPGVRNAKAREDLIAETSGVAGAATYMARCMDEDWGTLVY